MLYDNIFKSTVVPNNSLTDKGIIERDHAKVLSDTFSMPVAILSDLNPSVLESWDRYIADHPEKFQ
jgi:hypothetical protein